MADGTALTWEERQKRLEEIQKRKEQIVKERNSRVMIVRTNDMQTALNIVAAADRALNVLRRNAGLRFSFDKVAKYVDDFAEAVVNLHLVTEKMCKEVGLPYRAPAWIRERLGLPPEDVGENENTTTGGLAEEVKK